MPPLLFTQRFSKQRINLFVLLDYLVSFGRLGRIVNADAWRILFEDLDRLPAVKVTSGEWPQTCHSLNSLENPYGPIVTSGGLPQPLGLTAAAVNQVPFPCY
jgi:hypothetical protein